MLKEQGQLDEAAAQYQRALALKPSLFPAYNNLGNVLRRQGKLDEAVARFEHAVALNPDVAEVHKSLGNTLKQQGEFDRALASLERALALKPDHAEAHFSRTNLKTFRPGDPDLAALEALAADPSRVPADRMVYVHFALGKALEDVGEYNRAFEQWIAGNALKRREVDYDEASWQQTFRFVAKAFDASLLERLAGMGDPSPTPIFILGMPRSGSTLVEQILASHSQVHAAGELSNLDRVVRAVSDAAGQPIPYPGVGRWDSTPIACGGWGRHIWPACPRFRPARIGSPIRRRANFIYVGLIRLMLPNARIIHTMRDPVDICVSCFSRLFNDLPFTYDLGELGRYYRGYHELMAHWRLILPAGALLDVAYEDVVDDLERQARRLIDFCGLPWEDRCLNFHETSRPISTASNVQVRQPLYRSSLARWRRYEAYLEPLLAEIESCRQ